VQRTIGIEAAIGHELPAWLKKTPLPLAIELVKTVRVVVQEPARSFSVTGSSFAAERLPQCSNKARLLGSGTPLRPCGALACRRRARNRIGQGTFCRLAAMRGKNNWMQTKSLYLQTLMVGLLLLSGCDVVQSARNDLSRIVSSDSAKPRHRPVARATPAPKPAAKSEPAANASTANAQPGATADTTASATSDARGDAAKTEATGDAVDSSSGKLIGKSESEIRALLGPPTTVEERAPGKTWRYRDGKCTFDIQLYPDVQTRQFGTLAYEVKSDDNTDEGNRACLAQFRSRSESHG
jgi:hypothetical protein